MAPPVARAELSLAYPIWATDFDPSNNDFVIVGGGGGESKSGVGNKITLIDASRKRTLAEAVDIDLSRDEDSVTSLAVAKSTAGHAIVYAGINSSVSEQQKGKNEHFRAFKLGLPAKRKRDEGASGAETEKKTTDAPKSEVVGKTSLFRTPPNDKNETYQRILRLSRPVTNSGSRMGAIATGLAPAGEVVIFNASKDVPNENDVLKRIRLDNGQEAADVDVVMTESGDYLLAYCTSYEVFTCPVALSGKAKSSDPRLLYQYPIPDVFSDIQRPNFRSLRFLTPKLLAAVVNLPNRKGAELLLIDVPVEKALEGSVLLRKGFHKALKSATAFAVSTLPGPDASTAVQHVLAIAGQDSSITVLTLDQLSSSNHGLRFSTHTMLRKVHAMQLTSLALSSFSPPENPKIALPQFLKLASTGIDSSIVVHTFPLTPYPTKPKQGQKSRYYLRLPAIASQAVSNVVGMMSAIVLLGLGMAILQVLLEVRGGSHGVLRANDWMPENIKTVLARPLFLWDGPEAKDSKGIEDLGRRTESGVKSAKESLVDSIGNIIDAAKEAASSASASASAAADSEPGIEVDGLSHAVLITDSDEGVNADIVHVNDLVHSDQTEDKTQAHRKWEDLHEHERDAWKERLSRAGRWVAGEGEAVLKGVFFGELAGVVGEVIRG